MSTQSSSPSAWKCKACGRLVPGRVRTCRCGFETQPSPLDTEFLSEHPEPPARNQRTWVLVVALVIAAAAAVLYFVMPAPAAEPAQPTAASRPVSSAQPVEFVSPRAQAPDVDASPRLVPVEVVISVEAPPAAAANPPKPALEDIVSRALAAVVLIESPTAHGTGFFVTQDLLLTNAHVVGSNSFVTVRLAGGEAMTGRVERSSTDIDLAVVRATAKPEANQILQLGSALPVRAGQEVLAVGSPHGLQNTVTRGIVSAVRSAGGVELIQTDAAINPGNSGGPLLDRDGRVIGVTTLKMGRGAESIGFAVAIAHAVPLIENRPAPSTATAQAPSLPAVLSDSVSQGDANRRNGEVRFEQAMQAAAQRADQVDAQWKRLTDRCALGTVTTDAQRAWFVLRDLRATLKDGDAWCAAFADDLKTYVAQFGTFMAQASEDARRAGVYPGILREARRRQRLDWSGWDR
jgi:S1-C subfamily serine protease